MQRSFERFLLQLYNAILEEIKKINVNQEQKRMQDFYRMQQQKMLNMQYQQMQNQLMYLLDNYFATIL